jgi:large subunit ribosomal protein L18
MSTAKTSRRTKIKASIRKKISGVATKPRLSVFRSNSEIYAQLIDDENGRTIAAASSLGNNEIKGTKSERAKQVGTAVAKAALAAGINEIVFDRNGYLYHGRIKALAEGAREGGLKF